MFLGAILIYAFAMIPALLVFWVTSTGGTSTLFEVLLDFNKMPMALCAKTVQRIGTFIIPIFLLTNWVGLFVLE
jgi:ABC-2 type transport system permease protein